MTGRWSLGRGAGRAVTALFASANLLAAQPTAVPAAAAGDQYRISVLTFGPGDAVFERFGHNALRVQDRLTGSDLAYNWGNFSFDQPQFLRRFLSGDTRYWVEAVPTAWMLEAYVQRDRETHEQVLALTAEERSRVASSVAQSVLPENKYYRYDYFRDNCSTRLRDVLDSALGGALGRRFRIIRTPWTYRSESVRLTTPDAFVQSGIDVALGPRADVPMTSWEAMFIPMRLRDLLRDVSVADGRGGSVPLVSDEQVLYRAERAVEPPERRGLTLGAWGPILGAWALLLAPFGVAARRRTRLPATVTVALWYGLTGALGLALALMWAASAHVFWYRNLNLLLFSPLGLVAAIPLARAVRTGALSTNARALLIAVVAPAALALPLSVLTSQRLAGPLLLLLPAHLGLAIAIWRHTRDGAVTEGAR